MNNQLYIKYAEENGLEPLAWFEINYPAYAVKTKYLYPTSDPADFRDRALLQLIDLGLSYQTACSILMVNDPHNSILQRFLSDKEGPSLLHFDKELNRIALTPLGKQRVERIEFAKNGVSSCYIDGYTGKPFPADVVTNLSDRFICQEIKSIPNGEYPFNPAIEQKIYSLNTKLNDGKGHKYTQRLRLPDKSKEAEMKPLGPLWMKNLSVAFFIKDSMVVRRLFCDQTISPISPFGWMENLETVKLRVDAKNKRFGYVKTEHSDSSLFALESSPILQTSIVALIEKEYGEEFVRNNDVEIWGETGQCTLKIASIAGLKRSRTRLLSYIGRGYLPVQLNGMAGSLFIKIQADQATNDLAWLRQEIDKSESDWRDVVEIVKKQYELDWRKVLISIDRHDLLFRHDVEHYINDDK